MSLQHHSAAAEAVTPSDHVLLEKRATFGGHQLALCVTTADAASPDTIAVHVSYGSGQAEVTVRADKEEGSSRACGQASEAVGTLDSTVVECQEKESCFSDQAEDQAPLEVSTHGQHVGQFMKPPNAKNSKTDKTDRHSELRINRFDLPDVLDDKALATLLQTMPDVSCLSVDWRLDGRKLDIDIVSQHCRNLVEVDLTRFRLDTWSLKQLCIACPDLKVVKLPRKCDDSCVEVLLCYLPQLRSLDLAHTNVTGQFLGKSRGSMEKLSLAGCSHLDIKRLCLAHLSAENIPQTAYWEKIRELDLSSVSVTSGDLTKVLRRFPRLERLSLAHCDKIGSASLLQETLCERLRDLDLSHVGSLQASELLAALTRCPQLERLSIAGCTVKGSSCLRQLDQILAPLHLRELDVSGVSGLATVDLIPILIHSPQLERILASQLDNLDLTACLTQLSRCTELRELDVSHTTLVDRQIPPNVLMSLLLGCQKLERLLLTGCFSDSATLRQLVHCPKLRELKLLWLTTDPIDPTDLALGLSGCPLLERLSVVGLKAPLEQLVPTAGLPSLVYLNANLSGLTNNSLRRLPGLFPALHTLRIIRCNSVSEDGLMSYLPRLQQLRSLDLTYTPGVTDALLERLKESHLSKLQLNCPGGYKIHTAKGLMRLILGCPSLKLLGLQEEGTEDSVETMIGTIKQQLPQHRLLVIFVDSDVMSELSETGQVRPDLFVVDGITVNWVRD